MEARSQLFKDFQSHYTTNIESLRLKDLLSDQSRNKKLTIQRPNLLFDFAHQKINDSVLTWFDKLVKETDIHSKIKSMFAGERINKTCDWAVLHTTLRAPRDETFKIDLGNGKTQFPSKDVDDVRNQIKTFSEKVRNGDLLGLSNKKLKNYVVVGIGGSYLGIEFVYEALRWHQQALEKSEGRTIRF